MSRRIPLSKIVMVLVVLGGVALGALFAEVWPMTPQSRPVWLAIGIAGLLLLWGTIIVTRWRSRD